MACSPQITFWNLGFERSRNIALKKLPRLQLRGASSAKPSDSELDGEPDEYHSQDKREEGKQHVILVERYDNGTSKRYILGEDSQLRTSLERNGFKGNDVGVPHFSNTQLSYLPDIIKKFVLPSGYPGSVSEDYLEYMLLQFPTNVTAWICHALVTFSLLKAVGVGSIPGTAAAASAAAIRWVSKDGIGAVGRLFIGGRFGSLFDDDPKQWRMYADFIGSAGSIFDLSTQLYPAYFLPLASVGNLAKAVARGLKDPSFRVIQNHFAMSGNLGEVAAKEEVWEVTAQLIGLAFGILVLETPGISGSYPALASTWLALRLLHLWLRYQSLSVLLFNTINLKRARILVKSHVVRSSVPGLVACNRMENILSGQRFLKPQICFGESFEEMIGTERSSTMVKLLLKMYAKEKYILVVNEQQTRDLKVLVLFKNGADGLSVLRSVWQSYWLHENWTYSGNVIHLIDQSLTNLENRFEDFLQQLEGAGWDTSQINLKVPGVFIEDFGVDDSNSE